MTGLQQHTVQYSVVQYTERRLQCWNRSDASNKPTVGSGGLGHSSNRRERCGQWEVERRERGGWRWGRAPVNTPQELRVTPPDWSPVPVKRHDAWEKTPGAREEHHFLFEESVQEEGTAEEGGTDRGDCWGVGPNSQRQECTMLFFFSFKEERVGEERRELERRGVMWGLKQGKVEATYSREPTTVDGQTDTHGGVLYLQSSVEGERWEQDVIIITTTTREKGQSSCKEPHINTKRNTLLDLGAWGTLTNWLLQPGLVEDK